MLAVIIQEYKKHRYNAYNNYSKTLQLYNFSLIYRKDEFSYRIQVKLMLAI